MTTQEYSIDRLTAEQIKALYHRAIDSTMNLTAGEAREQIKYTSPEYLARAEYFLSLIGEAHKSGFDYAINHY